MLPTERKIEHDYPLINDFYDYFCHHSVAAAASNPGCGNTPARLRDSLRHC
jgi:hypothetical protein